MELHIWTIVLLCLDSYFMTIAVDFKDIIFFVSGGFRQQLLQLGGVSIASLKETPMMSHTIGKTCQVWCYNVM